MIMRQGFTFRDFLLVPKYSRVLSRKKVSTKTHLSRNVCLNIPIVSSSMDTVTETEMAIRIAELGGIGIIHRFLPIERQVKMVKKVKRSLNVVIENPYSIEEDESLLVAGKIMEEMKVNCLMVLEPTPVKKGGRRLSGIISKRDLLFQKETLQVREAMTPFDKLSTYILPDGQCVDKVNLEDIKEAFRQHKVEKFPVIDSERHILGLVAIRDIKRMIQYPLAVKDKKGRLLVGAAIGVLGDYKERAAALVEAGVDILNIDIAHGHHQLILDALREIKKDFPGIDVIAGAIATRKAAEALIAEGADGLRVGVGPGSHCTTRTVAGCGVPQITAIDDVHLYIQEQIINRNGHKDMEKFVPILADGGIRGSDDIIKAIAAGASTVILGKLLAGCDESPGIVRIKDGKRVKMYRGMASIEAAELRSKEDQSYFYDAINYVPEGIDSAVPYMGPVEEMLTQLMGGVHSGMSYLGASTLEEVHQNAEFIQITSAGWDESLTRRG